MTDVQPEHRLALRLDEKYGVGTPIEKGTIRRIGRGMDCFSSFNSEVIILGLENSGMLVQTREGITNIRDPEYALTPAWDAGISHDEIREDIRKRTPDESAEQSEFDEFQKQ